MQGAAMQRLDQAGDDRGEVAVYFTTAQGCSNVYAMGAAVFHYVLL